MFIRKDIKVSVFFFFLLQYFSLASHKFVLRKRRVVKSYNFYKKSCSYPDFYGKDQAVFVLESPTWLSLNANLLRLCTAKHNLGQFVYYVLIVLVRISLTVACQMYVMISCMLKRKSY